MLLRTINISVSISFFIFNIHGIRINLEGKIHSFRVNPDIKRRDTFQPQYDYTWTFVFFSHTAKNCLKTEAHFLEIWGRPPIAACVYIAIYALSSRSLSICIYVSLYFFLIIFVFFFLTYVGFLFFLWLHVNALSYLLPSSLSIVGVNNTSIRNSFQCDFDRNGFLVSSIQDLFNTNKILIFQFSIVGCFIWVRRK